MPKHFIIAKQIQIFTIGSINTIKNRSIIEVNSTNDVFAIVALDILPVIIYNVAISGVKASITPHNAFI